MRAVVQRVSRAEVRTETGTIASIGSGLCVLLAAGPADTADLARHLAERVATLRIFGDGAGKMNLDARAVGADVLVVSQFTIYADTAPRLPPSFIHGAAPELAGQLVDEFAARVTGAGGQG